MVIGRGHDTERPKIRLYPSFYSVDFTEDDDSEEEEVLEEEEDSEEEENTDLVNKIIIYVNLINLFNFEIQIEGLSIVQAWHSSKINKKNAAKISNLNASSSPQRTLVSL